MNAEFAHLIRSEGYSKPAGFGVALGGVLNIALIGYNFSSGNIKRMKESIKTAFLYSLVVAACGTVFLYFFAAPVVRGFISDTETVYYGQKFMKIICLACPTTAINFMVITVFQAIGKKLQPILLSLLRKGSLDIVFMLSYGMKK